MTSWFQVCTKACTSPCSSFKDTEGRLDLRKTISIPSGPFPGHVKRAGFFTCGAKEGSKEEGRISERRWEERNSPPKFPYPLPTYLKCFLQKPSFSLQLKFRQTANTGWVYSFQSTENELVKSVDLARNSGKAPVSRLGSGIYLLNDLWHITQPHWANHLTLTNSFSFSPHHSLRLQHWPMCQARNMGIALASYSQSPVWPTSKSLLLLSGYTHFRTPISPNQITATVLMELKT